MFIRIGNRYLNSQYVTEIRFDAAASENGNATIFMKDEGLVSGFVVESEIEALTEQTLPAPTGYDAHREFEFDFDDDEVPDQLEWKPVVAFVYHPGSSILDPIVADEGRLQKYAVRAPSGKVYTSSEEFFDTADEYRKFLCKELAKRKNKAA